MLEESDAEAEGGTSEADRRSCPIWRLRSGDFPVGTRRFLAKRSRWELLLDARSIRSVEGGVPEEVLR